MYVNKENCGWYRMNRKRERKAALPKKRELIPLYFSCVISLAHSPFIGRKSTKAAGTLENNKRKNVRRMCTQNSCKRFSDQKPDQSLYSKSKR